jgi:nucleotidyltransferase/DNA polymerase involved in DNA repair
MSEISSCSYAAREFGVKARMLVSRALELCPQLITIPYDFDAYDRVSRAMYDTVALYSLKVLFISNSILYLLHCSCKPSPVMSCMLMLRRCVVN